MSDYAHPNAGKVRELLGWSQADAQKATARIAALEAALKEIAQQKTTDEMDPLDVRFGDYEGAYDTMIETARAALGAA